MSNVLSNYHSFVEFEPPIHIKGYAPECSWLFGLGSKSKTKICRRTNIALSIDYNEKLKILRHQIDKLFSINSKSLGIFHIENQSDIKKFLFDSSVVLYQVYLGGK